MAEDMNKSAAETEEEYQPDLMTLGTRMAMRSRLQ